MNQKLIISFLLIALTGNLSCRKYNQGYAPAYPLPEKKWTVTTIAGDGRPVFADGPAMNSSFRDPFDVTVADDGAVYVADVLNHRVRKIAPDGLVTRYAGTGAEGFADGRAEVAQFGEEISGITIDEQGTIYVADIDNYRIRKISISGQVTTIAGNGISGFVDGNSNQAEFTAVSGIVIDKQ